jgi:hypothetical protein
MSTLRNHVEMIDLNPLVIKRERTKPPGFATPEEYHSTWYAITDRISYFPGLKGQVTYHGVFHDLADGLQTHVYAPLGLDIRSRWLVGGNLPHEPAAPRELGLNIPRQGLYLREDVDMRCSVLMAGFVRKTLVKAHSSLVDRLVEKAKIRHVDQSNASLVQRVSTLGPHAGGGFPSPDASSCSPSSAAGVAGLALPAMPAAAGYSVSECSDGYRPLSTGSRPVSAGNPPVHDPHAAYAFGQPPARGYPPQLLGGAAPPPPPEKDPRFVPGYVELPGARDEKKAPVELPG